MIPYLSGGLASGLNDQCEAAGCYRCRQEGAPPAMLVWSPPNILYLPQTYLTSKPTNTPLHPTSVNCTARPPAPTNMPYLSQNSTTFLLQDTASPLTSTNVPHAFPTNISSKRTAFLSIPHSRRRQKHTSLNGCFPAMEEAALMSSGELVQSLLDQFSRLKRGPNTLAESWENAQGDAIAVVFRQHGKFPAWLAYFLAKSASEGQHHVPGKADCTRLVSTLNDQSIRSLESVAKEVAAAIPPETSTQVSKVFNNRITQRSSKRQRKYVTTKKIRSSNQAQEAMIQSPRVRPRLLAAHLWNPALLPQSLWDNGQDLTLTVVSLWTSKSWSMPLSQPLHRFSSETSWTPLKETPTQ